MVRVDQVIGDASDVLEMIRTRTLGRHNGPEATSVSAWQPRHRTKRVDRDGPLWRDLGGPDPTDLTKTARESLRFGLGLAKRGLARRGPSSRPNFWYPFRTALGHFGSPDERRRSVFAARVCLLMLRLRHHADVDARGVAFCPSAEGLGPPFDCPESVEELSVTVRELPLPRQRTSLGSP